MQFTKKISSIIKLLFTIMYRSLFILLPFVLFLSLSPCVGQDIESIGRSLVKKYLGSTDEEEQRDALKNLVGLKVSIDKIKEWVSFSASYTPQQSGIHRKLVPVGDKKGECFVYLPSDYSPDRQWPVVLALHGVGGSGYGQIMAWLRSSMHKDDFIFIAPTYGSGLWWSEEGETIILSAINKAKQDYHLDTNKIYMSGFSSGGHGVWYLAIRYPSLFAAINPVAGECPLSSLLINLMHVPAYIIHGVRDTVIPVEAARDANSRLERLHYKVICRELPELKHQFPMNETGRVLEWFLTNKRTRYPKKIKYSTESTRYSVAYWAEITEFSGLIRQTSGVPRNVPGHLMRPEGFPVTASVEAEIKEENNEIWLTTHEIKTLRLYLADELVDMEKPLKILVNGKSIYSGKIERNIRTILDSVKKMNDQEALFSAYIDLTIPSDDQ